VEDHVAALEIVRHHRGDADAEIHVGAFLDEHGRVLRDALARQGRFAVVEARLIRGPSCGPAPRLAVDDLRRLDDARHEDPGQIDQLGGDRAGLHDLVHLDDRDPRGLGEAGIEILAAAAKLDVTEAVRAIPP
jgi:hypothetical protein